MWMGQPPRKAETDDRPHTYSRWPEKQSGEMRSAILVHGLLGSGRNWRTFSKGLVADLSEATQCPWTFFLVDLRNHGKTYGRSGFTEPHDMPSSARDLVHFAGTVVRNKCGRAPDAVIGHSLGGKVVLEYVKQMAEQAELEPPAQAWVLDSVPGEVPLDNSGVPEVLETIKKIPDPIPSKDWLAKHLKQEGYSQGLIHWLGTSLVPHREVKQGLSWQFDVHAAASMYISYRVTPYWTLLERPPPKTEIHIVRAADSDRWTEDVLSGLDKAVAASREHPDSGALHHLELPNAGHWLHVDNPRGLHEMMLKGMSKLANPS